MSCPKCGGEVKKYKVFRYTNSQMIAKTGCKSWVEDPDTEKCVGFIMITGQFVSLQELENKVKKVPSTDECIKKANEIRKSLNLKPVSAKGVKSDEEKKR